MAQRGMWGGVALALATLLELGCGGRPLDATMGAAGRGPGTVGTGTAGVAGMAGAAGTAGISSGGGSAGGDPTPPPPHGMPTPVRCACTAGAGVDLLACGNDWPPNTLRDAPEAVVTPDGATVVFNRCVPDAAGACTPGVFRWRSGEGASAIAQGAWAFAVSADGAKILGASVAGDAPFIADAAGAIEGLSLGRSYARLLSADGRIVVARVELSPTLTTTVRWTTPVDQMTLGDLWGGPDYSEPTAMNADASVIVGYGNTAAGQEPYLWTRAAGMVGLGTFPSRTVQAVARATSADGSVVVGSSLTDSGTAIFRWTAAGGTTAIGTLFDNRAGGTGGPESVFSVWTPPLLVSADGAVVAGTATQPSGVRAPFAFRWTTDGGLEPLTTAPASIVRAASADGRRIAGSTLASGAPPGMPFAPLPYQAFLFEEGPGTRPLADALAGVDVSGMTLGDPIALSADGSTLVGHATCAGAAVVYRVSLPH